MADSDWQRENGMAFWEEGGHYTPSSRSRRRRRPNYHGYIEGDIVDAEEDYGDAPILRTFKEAAIWSQNNGGKPFTRSPDGHGFIPKLDKDPKSS